MTSQSFCLLFDRCMTPHSKVNNSKFLLSRKDIPPTDIPPTDLFGSSGMIARVALVLSRLRQSLDDAS